MISPISKRMQPDPLRNLLRYPGNFDLVKQYLAAGFKIQEHHLIDAIESHDVATLVWLLQNNAGECDMLSVLTTAMEIYNNAKESVDFTKLTLTHYTKKSIRKLLKHGAIPGNEQIRMAILTRDNDMVRWCLEANEKFEVGLDLLRLAIENSDITGYAVLETLLKDVKVRDLLCEAIEGYGHPLVFALLKAPRTHLTMRILLENGAALTSSSEMGQSVLELAYQMDMMHVVLLLLSSGATLDTSGRMRLLMGRGVGSLDLIDDLKTFLMLKMARNSESSIFNHLPGDIFDEITTILLIMSAKALATK